MKLLTSKDPLEMMNFLLIFISNSKFQTCNHVVKTVFPHLVSKVILNVHLIIIKLSHIQNLLLATIILNKKINVLSNCKNSQILEGGAPYNFEYENK